MIWKAFLTSIVNKTRLTETKRAFTSVSVLLLCLKYVFPQIFELFNQSSNLIQKVIDNENMKFPEFLYLGEFVKHHKIQSLKISKG